MRLAESLGCKNQAFQLKRNVIGLQFHLETTPKNASALLDHLRDDLTPGPYVQTEAEIRVVPAAFYQTIHSIMNDVLSYLTLIKRYLVILSPTALCGYKKGQYNQVPILQWYAAPLENGLLPGNLR